MSSLPRSLALLPAFASVLLACGESHVLPAVLTTDNGMPDAALSLSAAEVDIDLPCGAANDPQRQLTLTNSSSSLVNWALADDTPGIFTVDPAYGRLHAGESVTLTVTASQPNAPVSATEVDDCLLVSDVRDEPTHALTLRERLVGGLIAFSPPQLSFGHADAGASSAPQTLRVANHGSSLVTVSLAAPIPEVAVEPAAPQAVAPGADVAFVLTWSPSQPGQLVASFRLASGDPQCAPLVEVPLSGEAN